MQPSDRMLCAFTQPPTVGTRFQQWPLHVTVVPWFRVAIRSKTIVRDLSSALSSTQPFKVEAGETTIFGHNKRVSLVHPPSPLSGIEQAVRRYLYIHGAWLVDETTRAVMPYRPHISEQIGERLRQGDSFICDKLLIVEQLGLVKMITEEVRLHDKKAAA